MRLERGKRYFQASVRPMVEELIRSLHADGVAFACTGGVKLEHIDEGHKVDCDSLHPEIADKVRRYQAVDVDIISLEGEALQIQGIDCTDDGLSDLVIRIRNSKAFDSVIIFAGKWEKSALQLGSRKTEVRIIRDYPEP